MQNAEVNKVNPKTMPVIVQPRPRPGRDFFKRVFDILMSSLGLLILSPFFLYVIIRIKREDPGPILYRGRRVGRYGREFNILKFRTMMEDAVNHSGAKITASDDDRITPLGHILRDTKLNELPQLWNVLVGEMSLVGPRPEDPAIVKDWPPELRKEILSVRPGMTSPASVTYRDEEKKLSGHHFMNEYMETIAPDKLRMDSLYVRHHTFLVDIDTILWTLSIFLPRIRNNRISEGWLYGGPFVRFRRDYLDWLVTDFLVAFGSIAVVGVLWRLTGPLEVGFLPAAFLGGLLALYISASNALVGLRGVSWSRPAAEDVVRLMASCVLAAIAFLLTHRLFIPLPSFPDGFVVTATLIILAGFIVVRYRLRLVNGLAVRWVQSRRRGFSLGERVLIVGAGEGGEFASWLLSRPEFRNHFSTVGFVDDDPSKQGLRLDGIKVLGATGDIPTLAALHDVGIILFAITKISEQDQERILSLCKRTDLPVVNIADIIKTIRREISKGLKVKPEEQQGEPLS
jgi:lipopolysaccharide/colanic/teichoic acid biosynthesis glycosyltransferase